MKTRRLVLSFGLALIGLAVAAGSVAALAAAGRPEGALVALIRPLVGYDYDESSGQERILGVSPLAGTLQTLATLNLEWAGVDQFAVDLDNQIVYLGGRAPGESNSRVYTVNLQTGSMVNTALLDTGQGGFGFALSGPGALATFDYDGARGRILALDPASSSTTPLATLDLDWTGVGMFAVDQAAHTAYLGGRKQNESFWRLYTTDLQSGNVVSTTVLDTGEGGFGFTTYKAGQLLAYTYEGGQGLIVSLDPSTGVTSTLATLPLDYSGTGQFAVDATNDVAYLGAQAPGESDWRLYIVDLSNGALLGNSIVDKGDGGFGFSFIEEIAYRIYFPIIKKPPKKD
jgi:hypothetical protein